MLLPERVHQPALLTTFIGTIADLYSHNGPSQEVIALHRQQVEAILGSTVSESIGNWAWSAYIMFLATSFAEAVRKEAIEKNSKILDRFADFIQVMGFIAGMSANLYAETFKSGAYFFDRNHQFVPDLIMGTIALGVTYLGVKGRIDHARNRHSSDSLVERPNTNLSI